MMSNSGVLDFYFNLAEVSNYVTETNAQLI